MLDAGYLFFGICFGNQLLVRALGFGTCTSSLGHRGINQPVSDMTTGKIEITAHNHGFAVDAPRGRDRDETEFGRKYGRSASHTIANDDVVEGLRASTSRRSPCNTPRPPPARTTPTTCSTASLISCVPTQRPAMPKRTTSILPSSGPARSSSARPASSTIRAPRPAACCAKGLRVILVNSNPATIMTDPKFADATYIEPITPRFVEQIIAKERPGRVAAPGGQTALNAAMALSRPAS